MGHSSQSLLIICFPGEDTQHKTAALEGLGWTSQSHLVVLRENCNPGFPPVPTPARLSLHLPLAKVPATHPLLCLRPSDALCSGSCQKPGNSMEGFFPWPCLHLDGGLLASRACFEPSSSRLWEHPLSEPHYCPGYSFPTRVFVMGQETVLPNCV